jgi:anti-sigma factor RsiW
MDCQDVRLHLNDYQRGHAGPDAQREIRAHLERCPACTHEDAAEVLLTEALERRLPQHPAPLGFKRRLAARHTVDVRPRPWWRRWRPVLAPAVAAAVVLAVGAPLLLERTAPDRPDAMVTEAVNDHLRLLERERPLEVASGGIHRVKPWFEGRVDFAPVVGFEGDSTFPLEGGAVGYFIDRKAAVFVYRRGLHRISLLVFRADGLPWPAPARAGAAPTATTVSRGFSVILWRAGDLGYALVSDVDPKELAALATRLGAG